MPHYESKWLSCLHKFLSTNLCSFDIDDTGVYLSQHQHNVHLMQYACEHNAFTPVKIINMNQCWLYLQVTTLSDFSSLYGPYNQRDYWVNPTTLFDISPPDDFSLLISIFFCRTLTSFSISLAQISPTIMTSCLPQYSL